MMQATRVTIASTKPLMADLLNDAHQFQRAGYFQTKPSLLCLSASYSYIRAMDISTALTSSAAPPVHELGLMRPKRFFVAHLHSFGPHMVSIKAVRQLLPAEEETNLPVKSVGKCGDISKFFFHGSSLTRGPAEMLSKFMFNGGRFQYISGEINRKILAEQ